MLEGSLSGGAISIEPGYACFREMLVQFLFDALGPGSEKLNVIAIAVRTALRNTLGVIAIVAEHPAIAAVKGQAYCAVHTLQPLPACAAHHKTRVASPVQQKHDLLAIGQP